MPLSSRLVTGASSRWSSKWRQLPNASQKLAHPAKFQSRSHWTDRLPTIIRPSFWGAIYPGLAKKLTQRKENAGSRSKEGQKKGWNPATFFFWMAMLIGSQSINLILLRNEWQMFTRKADAKITLLKEAIEKLERGEKVDVDRALGTGDEAQEREWKEVLEEVEHEDRIWQAKARKAERKAARKARREAQAREAEFSAPQSEEKIES